MEPRIGGADGCRPLEGPHPEFQGQELPNLLAEIAHAVPVGGDQLQ